MKKELEQKLADEFPFMRRDPKALKQHPIRDLYGAFGCDFDDGWYDLLYELCTEITAAYKSRGLPVNIEISQVKEKYGRLCFYFALERGKHRLSPGYTRHKMYSVVVEIVEKYENLSETICEVCGEPGSLRSDLSWIRTLCNTHYDEAKNVKPEDYQFFNLVKTLEKVDEYVKQGYTELEAIQKIREETEPTT